MVQDINNPKHYTADEGKVFKRIHNGFSEIEDGVVLGNEIELGEILVDQFGNDLETPIEDKIEYYTEIDRPERKPRNIEDAQFMAANESLNQ